MQINLKTKPDRFRQIVYAWVLLLQVGIVVFGTGPRWLVPVNGLLIVLAVVVLVLSTFDIRRGPPPSLAAAEDGTPR